jgi:hypothetical protein
MPGTPQDAQDTDVVIAAATVAAACLSNTIV